MEKKPAFKWIGLGLILFSLLFIPVIAAIQFTSLTFKQKAVITAALAIGGQILTWAGAFLLGKELLEKYRSKLNFRNLFKKHGS
ncbi:MAG: transporter suffix domain-containing protein [Elusimicrobiota bacterium]